MTKTLKIGIGSIALAAVAAFGAASVAGADVKITSAVTMSSTGGPNGAQQHSGNIVAYYQGDNLRIENADGSVMIYSATAGKMYRLDSGAKTYSVTPSPPTPRNAPPANNKDTFSFVSNGQTSTIAGQSAGAYQLAATGPAGRPPGGPGGGPGGPGGQGGPGGGGGGGGTDNGTPPTPPSGQNGGPPTASVSGTVWLSDAVKVDSGAQTALMFTVSHFLGLRGPLGKPLVTKLLSIGDVPLSANITVQMPAMQDGTQPTMTFTTTASAVSTDTLDSSLFTLPTDYQEVQFQGGPGGPGGGQGGGGGFGGPPPPQ